MCVWGGGVCVGGGWVGVRGRERERERVGREGGRGEGERSDMVHLTELRQSQ